MRATFFGVVAVAVLAGGVMAGIWWATRPAPELPPAATPRLAAAEPASPFAPSPALPSAPSPVPTVEAPALPAPVSANPAAPPPHTATVRRAPAPAVAPGTSWEHIPALTARRLPAISRALEAARPRLARCFDPEEQARQARRPFTSIGHPAPRSGGAVLMLYLEQTPGGLVRVVDAPVQSRGAAEDGLLACAQDALRGLELGPASPGGPSRQRVLYPLPPTKTPGVVTRAAPRVRLRPH